MNVYPFIEAEKAEQDGNVAMACVLLEVSRSAYYEWSKHVPSAREALRRRTRRQDHRHSHQEPVAPMGQPRITTELAEAGICVGQKRVARLMVRRGLIGRCKRRFKVTTTPDPDATSLAPDLIKRAFSPESHELRHGVVRRHHLHPHLGGLALPCHRHRPGQPASGRLRYGRSHAHRPGL